MKREEVRAGSGTDTLFLMESTWPPKIQDTTKLGYAVRRARARARAIARIFVGTLSHRPSREAQAELRIMPVRERTWRSRKRSERPILLPGGDSGSPLTQSNRRGSLNNRLASSSSEELQPRPKKKKETVYRERLRREGGRENNVRHHTRPEIHSFSRIPFYARILSVISQPGLN